MDLKDNFRNLPIFITKVVKYSTIFKYVFKNGEFPEELQGMIDKKTPGYSRVLDILRAKKISQQYGCTNEKELMEAGERDTAVKVGFFMPNSDHINEYWQNKDLN